MSDSFKVKFKINNNAEVSMKASKEMMIAELVLKFTVKVGLKEEHKASFFFNSNQIKVDSCKLIKDIGIKDNSVIQVKTEKPFDYKPVKTFDEETEKTEKKESSDFPQNNFGNMYPNMNYFGGMYPGMNNFGNMYPGMNNFGNMYPGMNNFGSMYPGMNNFGNNMIQIIFNYSGKRIPILINRDTPFSDLSREFCSQADIQNKFPTYFIGSRKILSTDSQTLSQLYLHNNSEISVSLSSAENEEYLILFFLFHGKIITYHEAKKTKFCDLSKKICIKAGIEEDSIPSFFYNSKFIESNNTSTLEELKILNQSKIEVVLRNKIIGA